VRTTTRFSHTSGHCGKFREIRPARTAAAADRPAQVQLASGYAPQEQSPFVVLAHQMDRRDVALTAGQ
jgi:hypothetical protein